MLTHLSLLAQIAEKGKSAFRTSEDTVTRSAELAVELFAELAEKVRGAFEKANPKVP